MPKYRGHPGAILCQYRFSQPAPEEGHFRSSFGPTWFLCRTAVSSELAEVVALLLDVRYPMSLAEEPRRGL
jgi:hypothetical protein